jgi:hypothetical protein
MAKKILPGFLPHECHFDDVTGMTLHPSCA